MEISGIIAIEEVNINCIHLYNACYVQHYIQHGYALTRRALFSEPQIDDLRWENQLLPAGGFSD
jgi:hypothetical protein